MPWNERVASGGITAGRYRWGRVVRQPGGTDLIVTFKRGTTQVNAYTDHADDNAMRTYSAKDYGGTGTDVYVALNTFGSSAVDTGQKESGVTNSRSASVFEDYNGGGRTQIDISSGQKGGAFGYTHDVVTRSGVSRWYLTTHLATTPGTLEWHGSGSYPTTGGSSTFIQAYASNTVLNEGCVADDGTDTAYGLALSSGSGAIRLTRLSTASGEGHFEYTPASWTNAHDRQVGQCFMIGAKFVGIVYNADRDETFVGITDDATSWDNTQVLPGEWVGGAAYDGVGYIADTGSPFSVYTSDGTEVFSDLGDDLPSAPALLTLMPEADGVEAWLTAESIYEYEPQVSTGRSAPWNSWGRPWGNPWSPWSAAGAATVTARSWEGWTEAEYETYIDTLISTHTSAWETAADAYADNIRHVITGLGFAYEVLGTASYATLANDLADRVIAAYPASFDLTRDMRMHEGWRYAGTVLSDTVLTDQATTVLEDSRNTIHGPGETWRVFSHESVYDTFQFSPYPAGRWQGQSTFTARLCVGYDSSWASDLETAFRSEVITETPGYWGAGYEESYQYARVGEKAGREIEWILNDLGDADLRAAAISAFERTYQSGYTFYEFIDGVTVNASYHDGIFAYDGWALLSQYNAECSTVCHNILDAVSTGDTSIGTIYFINYHEDGYRQFRLACSLLKAFAGFSA